MATFNITHIDHITLIVTDVAKARNFYGTVLGLKEIAAPAAFDFVALWFDLGGQYLHLLLKPQPDSISSRHPCFHVEDIPAAREHFQKLGVPVDETVKIPHCDRFFVRDPDGNRIEILKWERPYDPTQHGRFSA
ncbi:MAG: VOC family protein [Gemmataceae bacterium]